MLDTRILLVGVGYGILIRLVRSNLCRKVFSKDSLDFVTVLPFYVPPPVVEVSDDLREGMAYSWFSTYRRSFLPALLVSTSGSPSTALTRR